MKGLSVCIYLVLIASACSINLASTRPRTGVSSPTTWPSPLPMTQSQTPSSTKTFSTYFPAPTHTPTSFPCDPSKSYCIEQGHFLLDRPVAPPGTNSIDWGYPYGGTEGGTRDPHHGVEFYNASGTPVLAAADGRVILAGNDSQKMVGPRLNFYGNFIVIEHHFLDISQPVYTLYGHLSKVEVQTSQTVKSGDKIGEVGASGEAIGSHLHFEVRVGQNNYDSTQNPVLWLKPLTGDEGTSYGVIAGDLINSKGKLLNTTNISIQYFLDPNKPQVTAFQVDTYSLENQVAICDQPCNENFALADLQAGNYRISLMWGGRLYERWVIVYPGRLTFVEFEMDQ